MKHFNAKLILQIFITLNLFISFNSNTFAIVSNAIVPNNFEKGYRYLIPSEITKINNLITKMTTVIPKSTFNQEWSSYRTDILNTIIDPLLAKGALSQEQYDAIITAPPAPVPSANSNPNTPPVPVTGYLSQSKWESITANSPFGDDPINYSRVRYLRRFILDLTTEYLRVKDPAKNLENCSNINCESVFTCAIKLNQSSVQPICSKHSDCISKVCGEANSSGTRRCEKKKVCYKPVASGGSCLNNPVCKDGLGCFGSDTGAVACTPTGATCSTQADCCSGSCSNGLCEEATKTCFKCNSAGESVNNGGRCCPGLVADDKGSGATFKCYQPIPVDLEFDKAVSSFNIFSTEEVTMNFKECKFNWWDDYMQRLQKNGRDFQRELMLLAFEYVTVGDDKWDYWDINSTFKKMASRRKLMRQWYRSITKASTKTETDAELVKVLADIDLNGLAYYKQEEIDGSNGIKKQFEELASIKNQFQDMCDSAHTAKEKDANTTTGFIGSDGVTALDLQKKALEQTKSLIQFEYNNLSSNVYNDLSDLKRNLYLNTDWGKVTMKRFTSPTWTESRWFTFLDDFGFIGDLLQAISFPTWFDHTYSSGHAINVADLNLQNSEKVRIPEAIYAGLWDNYKNIPKSTKYEVSKHTSWYGKTTYTYRIDLDWPYADCGTGTNPKIIKASRQNCVNAFLITDVGGVPEYLLDPKAPSDTEVSGEQTLDKILFYKGGSNQLKLIDSINSSANISKTYLLGRRSGELNKDAVIKAFPNISQGNLSLNTEKISKIKERAILYFDQQLEGNTATVADKEKWAQYVYDFHYLFPKLSSSPDKLAYPSRGLLAYTVLIDGNITNSMDDQTSSVNTLSTQITTTESLHSIVTKQLGNDSVTIKTGGVDGPKNALAEKPKEDKFVAPKFDVSNIQKVGKSIVTSDSPSLDSTSNSASASSSSGGAINNAFKSNLAKNKITAEKNAKMDEVMKRVWDKTPNKELLTGAYRKVSKGFNSPGSGLKFRSSKFNKKLLKKLKKSNKKVNLASFYNKRARSYRPSYGSSNGLFGSSSSKRNSSNQNASELKVKEEYVVDEHVKAKKNNYDDNFTNGVHENRDLSLFKIISDKYYNVSIKLFRKKKRKRN